MNQRSRIPVVVGLAIVLAVAVAALVRPARVAGQSAPAPVHDPMRMDAAEMQQRADRWWASHRPAGASSRLAPVATFAVEDYLFDADGNLATTVDTVLIHVGDTVMWQWINGFHTVTNGVDGGDPQAGTIFNQPIDSLHPTFSYTFDTEGTFPFYCAVHEGFMIGWVVVQSTAGVAPGTMARLGFTRDPSPNPSDRGVSFAFSLERAGPVRAEVFDTHGRRVAVLLDRDLGPGAHVGAWDGRRADGGAAGTGIYYLRLRLPGYVASRAVTLVR